MFKPEAYVDSVLDLLDDEQTLVAENIIKNPLDMQERYMSLVPDGLLDFIVKQWRPGMTSDQADKIFRKYSSFNQGGSVTTPKRGLVDEPGSYAGNKFQIEQKENSLKKIAEIIQKADIEDNVEYLMRDKKSQIKRSEKVRHPKGMVSDSLALTLQGLQTNQDDLLKVADLLGEDTEYILDIIDESKYFADEARSKAGLSGSRLIEKDNRDKFLKIEKWMTRNASKFDNPVKLKKAINKRFGNNNVLNMAVENKRPPLFSDEFSMKILGAYSGESSKLNTSLLDNVYSTVIYNFNTKVRDDITKEFKNILEGGPAKVKQEARAKLRSSELLRRFNLDKKIEGPISNLIYKEIGETLYENIQVFRNPRFRTTDLLQYLSTIVDPEYKTQFLEAKDAITAATNGNMKMAREKLKIADNIMYDHKIPQSIIDLGYADPIEYTKVSPTTENFNVKIKNPEFDKEINKLIRQYEKATNPIMKTQLIEEMNILKDKFSSKYGGYLDEVSIGLDKEGKLKFSSTADPVGKETDFLKELLKTQYQEKGEVPNTKEIKNLIKKIGCTELAAGGRVGFNTGANCYLKGVEKINSGKIAKGAEARNFAKFANQAYKLGRNVLKFGVIPEMLWIGGETLIRMGMGEGLNESFKYATSFLPGGTARAKEADLSSLTKRVGLQNAKTIMNIRGANESKEKLNDLYNSLETDLAFAADDWQAQADVKERYKKLIENAKKEYNLKSDFGRLDDISSGETIAARRLGDEAEDIKKSKSLFTQMKNWADEIRPDTVEGDIETVSPSEADLERGKTKTVPLFTMEDIAKFFVSDEYAEDPKEKLKILQEMRINDINPGKTDLEKKLFEKQQGGIPTANEFVLRKIFSKAAENPAYAEQLFGASGMMGEPIQNSIIRANQAFPKTYGTFASGGIANLTRTIPPERGPNSQGLASLKKYGKQY
jgi:hypothetical protein